MRARDALGILLIATAGRDPAAALTWTRVEDVPAGEVYSVQLHGTTLYVAAGDRVFLGANLGATWTSSNLIGARGVPLYSVVPTTGTLWVGSSGQGVFRGTAGGTMWMAFNDGLTGLGSNYIFEMAVRDRILYAATGGAGVFAFDLRNATAWADFNLGLPVSTAGGVSTIVLHGSTLIAPAGGNGFVYRCPAGSSTWQEIAVEPPLLPGFVATDLVAGGTDLLLASGARIYRSSDDALTWTRADQGLVSGSETFLAYGGGTFFAAVDYLNNSHRLFRSVDAGRSWRQIDAITGSYCYELEVTADKLYAARTDGLWWTLVATTPVQATSWSRMKSRFGR